ncbi:MAG: hydrogenase maturation protease [Chloroflexota bacterium]|nr:MAG: hydrogenase maturation protease [Chloroflexota bacterium]
MQPEKRRVVLGLGNLLCRDEGIGIHAVQALEQACGEQAGFEWVDGGVLGMSLLPLVEECSHLLVLDAVDAGLPEGSLVELSKEEIPLFAGIRMSEHQVGFQDVLGLASLRGNLPEHVRLLGVQPADLSAGMELSREAAAALPAILERSRAVISEWGHFS